MFNKLLLMILITAVGIFNTTVNASVIMDFEGLFSGPIGSSYNEDGFMLVASDGLFALTPGDFSITGSVSLLLLQQNSTIALTKDDGGVFTPGSIDLAEFIILPSNVDPFDITFQGTKSDGSQVSQSFTLDGDISGAETFTFGVGLADIVLLTWMQGATNHAFDNIVVSPIPIPAAIWLFGTALIGLFGFNKRSKSA